jgi:predicted HTH domain antitoxin
LAVQGEVVAIPDEILAALPSDPKHNPVVAAALEMQAIWWAFRRSGILRIMTFTVDVPDTMLRALDVSPAQASAKLRLAAAMKFYELGELSSGAAAELAGIPKPVFLTRLADFGIDAFRMKPEELDQDIESLRRHEGG